jgi:hypothetical protein
MSKIALPKILKTEEIGNSLGKINKSFDLLKKQVENQNESLNEIDNFKKTINILFDKLKFSHDFMKRRNFIYQSTWRDISINKEKYIKPLILMYPQKFRDDVSAVTNTYIENVIHDWITDTYIIKSKKIDKPNYVEGQRAVVYYLKCREAVRRLNEVSTQDSITCITENIEVVVKCESRRAGQVCIGGCGCVNCAATSTCEKKGQGECKFSDNNISSKTANRYLKANTSLKYEDYFENKFEFVRLVVEDCIWKVDKSN